jgi:molybdopterin-guanine dinucleotide biosynthesis protein A
VRADGLVLAGGRSRRFGADKRVAVFHGQELVRRAVRTLASVAGPTLYVATGARPERLPGTAGAVCIADSPPGCGPLGGIAAALARTRAPGILALGCDLPLVRAATLERVLQAGLGAGRPAAVRGPHGWEPLIAYWPRAMYKQVRAALWLHVWALHELLERTGAAAVVGVDPAELVNVNTRADLAQAASRRGNAGARRSGARARR